MYSLFAVFRVFNINIKYFLQSLLTQEYFLILSNYFIILPNFKKMKKDSLYLTSYVISLIILLINDRSYTFGNDDSLFSHDYSSVEATIY